MARSRSAGPLDRAGRNGLALLVLLAGAVVVYLVLMAVLTALLEGAVETLSRDRIWKLLVYWAIFIAPAVPALGGAAALTGLVVGRFDRRFVVAVTTGLMAGGTAMLCVYLAAGGAPGITLAILSLARAVLAWAALRWALGRPRS
jgi:hypothetical protein